MSYAIINAVFAIEGISSTQKIVALVLAQHANDDGECFPSMERLTRMSSLTERTVQGAIASLEKEGHLSREFRVGRATIYHLHPRRKCTPAAAAPPQQMHPTPAAAAPPPPQQMHPTPAAAAPITGNLTGQLNRSLNNTPFPPDDEKPKKPKSTRFMQMEIPDEWILWCINDRGWSSGKAHDVFEQFTEYWLNKAGRAGEKIDWFMTWKVWCKKDEKYDSNRHNQTRRGNSDQPSAAFRAAASIVDEERRRHGGLG